MLGDLNPSSAVYGLEGNKAPVTLIVPLEAPLFAGEVVEPPLPALLAVSLGNAIVGLHFGAYETPIFSTIAPDQLRKAGVLLSDLKLTY